MDLEATVNLGSEGAAKLEDVLKDFPPGPLDTYRKKASFDWKMMKLLVDGEDLLLYKVLVVCIRIEPI